MIAGDPGLERMPQHQLWAISHVGIPPPPGESLRHARSFPQGTGLQSLTTPLRPRLSRPPSRSPTRRRRGSTLSRWTRWAGTTPRMRSSPEPWRPSWTTASVSRSPDRPSGCSRRSAPGGQRQARCASSPPSTTSRWTRAPLAGLRRLRSRIAVVCQLVCCGDAAASPIDTSRPGPGREITISTLSRSIARLGLSPTLFAGSAGAAVVGLPGAAQDRSTC